MRLSYSRHQAARMFEHPVLEALSKVHPSVPFLFYGPVVAALLAWSFGRAGVALVASSFGAGWLVWSAMEYFIHRFLFHWEGSGRLTRRLHQILHGYHHRYPDDERRLVMPLGASLPLALLIAGLLFAVGRPQATVPLFAGIVAGYLFYDFTHWSTHHREPRTRWGRAIRAHHMAHHFADPSQNFGISHRWLDGILGTLRRHSG